MGNDDPLQSEDQLAEPPAFDDFHKIVGGSQRWAKLRYEAWVVLEFPHFSKQGRRLATAMLGLVVVFVVFTAVDTVAALRNEPSELFLVPNAFCTLVFSVEIVVRLVVSPGRSFFHDWLNLVDVLSVLPFFLEMAWLGGLRHEDPTESSGLGFLRAARVVRVFRVLKLGRYNEEIHIFNRTLARSASAIVMVLLLCVMIIVIFAGLEFQAEKDAQPDVFTSMPQTMWWAIVTLTTVGYGDMFPVTTVGKAIACVLMVVGSVTIKLPITIMGATCLKEYVRYIDRKKALKLARTIGKKMLTRTRGATNLRNRGPRARGHTHHAGQNVDWRRRTSLERVDSFIRNQLGEINMEQHPLKKRLRLFRLRVWETLEVPMRSRTGRLVALVITIAIVSSVTAINMESFDNLSDESRNALYLVDVACVAVFSLDTGARLLSTPKTLEYFKDWLNLVDLLSILPFYIKLLFQHDFGFLVALRVFRVIRITRVFRLARLNRGMSMFIKSLGESWPALSMLLFATVLHLLIGAALIFELERGRWNEEHERYELHGERSSFQNIPEGFWWAMQTITTVGYGEVPPTTFPGYVMASFLILSGVTALTLPVTIIGVNFSNMYEASTEHTDHEEAKRLADEKPVHPFVQMHRLDDFHKEMLAFRLYLKQKYPKLLVTVPDSFDLLVNDEEKNRMWRTVERHEVRLKDSMLRKESADLGAMEDFALGAPSEGAMPRNGSRAFRSPHGARGNQSNAHNLGGGGDDGGDDDDDPESAPHHDQQRRDDKEEEEDVGGRYVVGKNGDFFYKGPLGDDGRRIPLEKSQTRAQLKRPPPRFLGGPNGAPQSHLVDGAILWGVSGGGGGGGSRGRGVGVDVDVSKEAERELALELQELSHHSEPHEEPHGGGLHDDRDDHDRIGQPEEEGGAGKREQDEPQQGGDAEGQDRSAGNSNLGLGTNPQREISVPGTLAEGDRDLGSPRSGAARQASNAGSPMGEHYDDHDHDQDEDDDEEEQDLEDEILGRSHARNTYVEGEAPAGENDHIV